jgi:hypothetical protein
LPPIALSEGKKGADMRKLKSKSLWRLAPLALFTLPLAAFGGESRQSRFHDVPREFDSPRSLGIGGTGVSWARGLDALYLNPAGTAKSKALVSEVVLASPMVTAGDEGKKLYEDIQNNTDTFDMIEKYQNKSHHVGVQNVTGVAFRRASLGLIQKVDVDAYAGLDPLAGVTVAEARAVARTGLALGTSRGFFDDTLFLGMSAKVVQKRELGLQVNALEAQEKLKGRSSKELLNENSRQGTGVGADLGLLYRIQSMDTKPTFGLVYRNLGMKYSFAVPDGKKAPQNDLQMLDVGVSIEPGTKRSYSRLAVDYRDVMNASRTSEWKRLHLGGEVSFQDVVGFLGGLGQGYPSVGAFLNLKIVRIEAGFYGKEMGENLGELRSRRYFARASIGWLE